MTDVSRFGDDSSEMYIPIDPIRQARSEAIWREFADAMQGGRMFIRVRSARPGAAQHEFDVPLVTYEHHPDLYEVVDKKPVAKQRPASHVSGVEPETAPKRAKPSKTAPKTGEEAAPSVGPTEEEK